MSMSGVADVALTGAAAASLLVERAARERELVVQRLDPETVDCRDGQRRVLFHALASSTTSRLAQVLGSNAAWLRGHLARHGLPVVPTRLVAAGDVGAAGVAARELGLPVRVRPAGWTDGGGIAADAGGAGDVATDMASFHRCWQAVAAAGHRGPVILERLDPAPVCGLVAIGDTVTRLGERRDVGVELARLASRAIAVLGVDAAVVRLTAGAPPQVVHVDVAMHAVAAEPEPRACQLAAAVLSTHFGPGARQPLPD